MEHYVEKNLEVINGWCVNGWEWSVPVSHEEYEKAKVGRYQIYLTPTKVIPAEWLKDIKGKKVLALASGGGQQGPILTALGAGVTVMDFTAEQIKREREVQQREGYHIEIIQADMTKPFPFEIDTFDMIVHPVSNIFVRDVLPIWKECYRVLKQGGTLMAGLDNGINYIVDEREREIVNALPFDPLENGAHYQLCMENNEGFQFSHSIEEQIGGQLKAGFALLDIYGDTNRTGRLSELNVPLYWATLSRKM